MKTKRVVQVFGIGVVGAVVLSGCARKAEPEYARSPGQQRVVVEPPPRSARPDRVQSRAPERVQQPLTPRPGPDFKWVAAYRDGKGFLVPGHWEYTGPVRHNQVWVPRHRQGGRWVNGRWKTVKPPRQGMTYVPGHYGPDAVWIDGYWE